MIGMSFADSLKNLKITTKLTLLIGVFTLGFLGFAWVAFRTIGEVKVTGPMYAKIVEGKDIIADVLPPPEYIIESYLVVLELLDEADPREKERLLGRCKILRDEYDLRHAYWDKELPEGPMRQTLVVKSFKPAIAFYEMRDREFLPALLSGDSAKATHIANGPMRKLYLEHRSAVDEVVAMATRSNEGYEKQAADMLSGAYKMMYGLTGAMLLVILFFALMINQMGRSLSRRVDLVSRAAKQVAEGDLTVSLDATADDETGHMMVAVGSMTKNLNSLVSRVKQSSIELMSTATEIAATSKQQESTVNGFGASTTQIAAAVKEISATSQELLTTMETVNSGASNAATLAERGRVGLIGMEATMKQLVDSTGSISSKLSVIREKAGDINLVVTTITKVADQTNLLSVNAAIEAEKAGEYGRGFLVLAREIRRLADQTAVSTLDIEKMVRQMQGAVTAGVMEMDKFTEEVRRGVGSVGQISTQLAQIIEQVQTLSERFDSVNNGMRSQSEGAKQINQAMTQLTDGARQTSASLKEFNNATTYLRQAVDGLKQEISHFKVNDQ
jgi:methyl-accepting chemotaxis protein WspA